MASGDCLLVDPWNALGTGQVFVYTAETPALARTADAISAPGTAPSG